MEAGQDHFAGADVTSTMCRSEGRWVSSDYDDGAGGIQWLIDGSGLPFAPWINS